MHSAGIPLIVCQNIMICQRCKVGLKDTCFKYNIKTKTDGDKEIILCDKCCSNMLHNLIVYRLID